MHHGVHAEAMPATRPAIRRTLITIPSDTEIRLERTFDAPRDLVFRAYTDPALLARWLGPRRLTTRIETLDVRPGGMWRFVHVDEDGTESVFSGEFIEVVRPERISQTWTFEAWPDASSVETATFTEKDGRTTVVSLARYKAKEHRDGHLQSGMETGVQEGYERLDEVLASLR
jgi:uncharacterized protein YndB with AHSA1/START domain